jgi:hypothetical protein
VTRLFPVNHSLGLRSASICAALLMACGLAGTLGCTVGPRYKRPAAPVPDTWKGEGPWQGRMVADIS